MSTRPIARSKELEEIVLTYFRSYGDEAQVRPKPNIPGAVDIVLRGALAQRFETVSVPEKGHPGKRVLRLLFNQNLGSVAPGYELVVPRHHILRLIRNDLATRASFARSGALLNIDENFADLKAMGVTIRYADPEVSCQFICRRFYAVRYMLRLSAYEPVEDVILIVIDPDKNSALPACEAAKLAQLSLVDLETVPYRHKLRLVPPERELLSRVFQLAELEAKQRVADLLQERAARLADMLEEERERIQRHYEAEMAEASVARRCELERLQAQQLEDLRERYKLRAELALLSLEEIIVPLIEYTLVFHAGKERTQVDRRFILDPVDNTVRTSRCDHCGQDKRWAYCARGKHLLCEVCGHVEKCSYSGCIRGACAVHTVRCARCSEPLCFEHERACHYCESDRRYCHKHVLESFEGREICPSCARFCGECGQAYPPELSVVCVVCSKNFCKNHSRVCPNCGKPHCHEHGSVPRLRKETYCHTCLNRCAYCPADALYLKADLKFCAECGTAMCPEHVGSCVSCGRVLCRSHGLSTPHGTGCAACYATCQTCGLVSHRSALRRCHLCPSDDRGLHCDAHSSRCEICWKSTCHHHIHSLKDSREACSLCSKECVVCSCRFALDQLVTCSECLGPVCRDDSVWSQFRSEPYCVNDARSFVHCGGCNRQGPGSQLEVCTLCGISYCPHCIPEGKNTRCAYCKNLRPLKDPSGLAAWYQALSNNSPAKISPSQRKAILTALAKVDPCFSFTTAENANFLILCAAWKPGFINAIRKWFRKVTGFVIIREKNSSRLQVRVNP